MISKYSQLCPVRFGAGASAQIPEAAKELGIHKALIVTDATVDATGHPNRMIGYLNEAGIETVKFSEIEMDAPDHCVNRGAEIAAENAVDGVIAIGGGSCLDAGKAISLVAANAPALRVEELFDAPPGSLELKPPLKNIMAPTTAGTGSESTIVAVISDTKGHRKCGCMIQPNAAIVDPELELGLDPLITAFTAMDAFSHCSEALASKGYNPHSDLLALDAIRRIVNWCPVAVKDVNDLRAREELALASNFAGKAFNDSMVNVGHALAHSLGAVHHVPHGIACALVTPVVLERTAASRPEVFQKVAGIFGVEAGSLEGEALSSACSEAVRSFIAGIGIPSLKAMGYSREEIIACAEYAKTEFMRFACLVDIPDGELAVMLGRVYDSYQ